jgi:hypothetical protein
MPLRHPLAIAATVALVAACSTDGTSGSSAGTARVIFAHGIVDTGSVDVRVSTKLTAPFTSLAFGSGTAYETVTSGILTISVQASPSTGVDTPAPLANLSSISVPKGASVTLVAAGQVRDTANSRGVAITAYVDDVSPATTGQARLRVINVSPDAGAVDVYATPTGGVQGTTPTWPGVDYRSAVSRTVNAGSYTIAVTPLSDPATILTSTTVSLPSTGVQTLVVRGYAGTLPFGIPVSRRIGTTILVNVAP